MRLGTLAIVSLLAACGVGPKASSLVTVDTLPGGIPSTMTAAPTQPGAWSFVHERDVQPAAGAPGELLDPQDIALADDGTLFVVESKPAEVHLYGPDGAFLRSLGGEGAGPGEFTTGYIAVHGDTLVLQDPAQSRATVYRISTGAALSTRPTVCCYFAPIGIDASGAAWLSMLSVPDSDGPPTRDYLRLPIDAAAGADTVALVEPVRDQAKTQWNVSDAEGRMRMSVSIPLVPSSQQSVDPTGGLVVGFGGEYRLRRTRDGRDTTALFGRPFTAAPVTDAERQRLAGAQIARVLINNSRYLDEIALRKAFDPARIPDQHPAFDRLFTDGQGRVLVRRAVADSLRVHFDLFGPDNVWLDSLALADPAMATNSYATVAFSVDHLAVLGEDASGLPIVRIYRLRGPSQPAPDGDRQ